MSVRGWTAPDWHTDAPPRFAEFAHAYNAALPKMQRPYILPGDAGVLWLSQSDSEGVWFSFKDQPLPDGVEARPAAERKINDAAAKAGKHRVYRVTAENLPEAFDLRTGGEDDPRRVR